MCVRDNQLFTPSVVNFCAIISPCPRCHGLWGWFTKSLSLIDMTARCYVMPISMHVITSFSRFSLFAFLLSFLLTHLSHFHHIFKITLSLPPSPSSQQTIQAAGCSPWQRRPAVQWAANWWLVYKMIVWCVCTWACMGVFTDITKSCQTYTVYKQGNDAILQRH